MLEFDGAWRFRAPADGEYLQREIPGDAVADFRALIDRVLTQGNRWDLLEHFKQAFSRAAGTPHGRSSSQDWADTDLNTDMREAARNAPLFIEALFDACAALRPRGIAVPDTQLMDEVCDRHRVGYILQPPNLRLRAAAGQRLGGVAVQERPPTIAGQAITRLHESLARADELLEGGRGREAVQETLWVLESLATAFRGVESEGGAVRGRYFNEIARDLRRLHRGTTLEQALRWAEQLHGYLSNPAGGGVRHGLDLTNGVGIDSNSARLFCNLVRSYIAYLLAEHERLAPPQ